MPLNDREWYGKLTIQAQTGVQIPFLLQVGTGKVCEQILFQRHAGNEGEVAETGCPF